VDENGTVTFTPEDGFTGDPTPVEYTAEDNNGNPVAPATVTVDYPPVAKDDSQSAEVLGETVEVDVLSNDQNTTDPLDPGRVSLVVPSSCASDNKIVDTQAQHRMSTGAPLCPEEIERDAQGDIIGFVMPGEGTWTVNEDTGEVTFVPDSNLESNPTPVNYTVRETNGDLSNEATVTIRYPSANGYHIGDYFWIDHDGDNLYDGGDKGVDEPVAHALVELLDANGSKLYWTDDQNSSLGTTPTKWPAKAITDENGKYGFDVPAGTYQVRFILPEKYLDDGYDFTGGKSNDDSNTNVNTANTEGITQAVTVGPGHTSASLTLDAAVSCGCAGISGDSADAMNVWTLLFMIFGLAGMQLFFRKEEESV